ncbi:hypothetical protein ACFCWG_24895 [Streptomyces sp. NPDC056390]|uniref:hypothetical protein n=1 Tax=Streptomyces sp. NPDC056390 TaxID=3345806 RepID=UPI0035E2D3F1
MRTEPERERTEAEVAAERRRDLVASLERERDGYKMRGLGKRVAEVDAELKRLGADKQPATEREATEPRETAVESKPRRTAARGK